MLLGIYLFCACVYAARKINNSGISSLEHLYRLDKGSCVDLHLLMPEFMLRYVAYMLFSKQQARLALYLTTALLTYACCVVIVSELFGILVYWTVDSRQSAFAHGLLLYILLEFILFIVILLYRLFKGFVESTKKMQDLETKQKQKAAEEGVYMDATVDIEDQSILHE